MDGKVESSMPVQSRIDLKVLAKLVIYWESEGVVINSMSRLVSWSIEALNSILISNEVIDKGNLTLEEAFQELSDRGLIQKSMQKRMEQKYIKARGLENIRLDGFEPSQNTMHYKDLHKKNAIVPFSGGSKKVDDETFEKTMGMTKDQARDLVEGRNSIRVIDQNSPKGNNSIDHLLNKPRIKPSGDPIVDLETSLNKMKEADEKLKGF